MVLLNLFITDSCNLECPHCYVARQGNPSATGSNKFMKLEDVDRLLRSPGRATIDLVHVFGGEPFLHPQVRDIIEIINDAGIHVNVATNGTLLSDHLSWIPRMNVSISMNLLGEEITSPVTGTGYPLEPRLKSARSLVYNDVEVNGIVCVIPREGSSLENARFYVDYMDFIHDATGIESFFLLYFSRLGRGSNMWNSLFTGFFRPDNWLLFLKQVKYHLEDEGKNYRVYVEPAFEADDLFPQVPTGEIQCDMLVNDSIVFDPDLNAYPCPLLKDAAVEGCKVPFKNTIRETMDEFTDLHEKFIGNQGLECLGCDKLGYCCPCIAYALDSSRDYRCSGKNKNGSLMGCPLFTVPLNP